MMTRKRFHKLYTALWARTAQRYHLPNSGKAFRGIRDTRANGMSYDDMWAGLARYAADFEVGNAS